jgi:uncharacterized protein YneF (UPF0154 family)
VSQTTINCILIIAGVLAGLTAGYLLGLYVARKLGWFR